MHSNHNQIEFDDPDEISKRYQAVYRLKQVYYPDPVPYHAVTEALGDEEGGYTAYDMRIRQERHRRQHQRTSNGRRQA